MTTTTPESRTGTTRLHGLDALRAVALGLGIVLHSLLPFVPVDLWFVLDSRRSDLAVLSVDGIHLFRMVLFMTLAGYFGRMVVQRRGPRAYVRDRGLRILLPLVVFGPIMMVGIIAVALASLPGILYGPPGAAAPPVWMLFLSPAHLWFLAVVVQCVVITIAARAVLRRVVGGERLSAVGRHLGGWLSGPAGVLLAAVPYTAALLLQGTVDGGILEPGTVLPRAAVLTGYLGAFAVGWFLHARTDALTRIARVWPVHLGIATVTTALHWFALDAAPLVLHAAVVGVAGWAWTFALIGIVVRYLTRENAVVRYLADASYWVYILHLVVLMAVQLPMTGLDWPIPVKLLIAWTATAAITLVSYDLLVRGTWVGAWLNGRRRAPAWRTLAQRRVRR